MSNGSPVARRSTRGFIGDSEVNDSFTDALGITSVKKSEGNEAAAPESGGQAREEDGDGANEAEAEMDDEEDY